MASSEKVRWGILGPGGIAARTMRDAGRASNLELVAVASRDQARAAEFASRFGIGRVHPTYEALLADPEVDAVYIATPNSLHHPQTMRGAGGRQARPVREALHAPPGGGRPRRSTPPTRPA